MEIKQVFVLAYRKYVDLSLIVGACQSGFDFNTIIRCNLLKFKRIT